MLYSVSIAEESQQQQQQHPFVLLSGSLDRGHWLTFRYARRGPLGRARASAAGEAWKKMKNKRPTEETEKRAGSCKTFLSEVCFIL